MLVVRLEDVELAVRSPLDTPPHRRTPLRRGHRTTACVSAVVRRQGTLILYNLCTKMLGFCNRLFALYYPLGRNARPIAVICVYMRAQFAFNARATRRLAKRATTTRMLVVRLEDVELAVRSPLDTPPHRRTPLRRGHRTTACVSAVVRQQGTRKLTGRPACWISCAVCAFFRARLYQSQEERRTT